MLKIYAYYTTKHNMMNGTPRMDRFMHGVKKLSQKNPKNLQYHK